LNWLEISLRVDEESAEAISELFNQYGEGGAVVEAWPDDPLVTVKTFVPSQDERLTPLYEALWHLGQIRALPEPQVREVKEEEWADAWKAHYEPQHIGRRLVVCPSWQRYLPSEGEVIITLDPGMAFGTGLHPTTHMCLEALEEHLSSGTKLLDVGTGSGILAIAAVKLGARSVLALDTDPLAVKIAKENLLANDVRWVVKVKEGSLEMAKGHSFDLIVVNILARTIADLIERGLLDHLKPEGLLIAAGIMASEEEEVRKALREWGLKELSRLQKGDWVTLIERRGGK
jgi:ribosomal protein L11 methyltransferase